MDGSGLIGASSTVVAPGTIGGGQVEDTSTAANLDDVEVSDSGDLTQVLTGLQQSGQLGTVLQQQPQLVQGETVCNASFCTLYS